MAQDFETWYTALAAPAYQVCYNDDPWLTFIFFTARSNSVTFCVFDIRKSNKRTISSLFSNRGNRNALKTEKKKKKKNKKKKTKTRTK